MKRTEFFLPGGPFSKTAVAEGRKHDMSRDEVRLSVARAYRLRAEAIHEWGQRVSRTVASLWRRPGSALPQACREKMAHSASH